MPRSENRTARMNRETSKPLPRRPKTAGAPAPFVRNHHVPLDLLNNVYLQVEGGLRREIMRKFHGVSPAELEAALEASRNHLSSAYGALPSDFQIAKDHVEALDKRGALKAPILVQLLRENQRTASMLLRETGRCRFRTRAPVGRRQGYRRACHAVPWRRLRSRSVRHDQPARG